MSPVDKSLVMIGGSYFTLSSGVSLLRSSLNLCLGLVILSLTLLESTRLKAQGHNASAVAGDSSSLAGNADGQQSQADLQSPVPSPPEFPVTVNHFWNRISPEMAGGYAPVVSRGTGYYGSGFTASAGANARINGRWRVQAEGQILGQQGVSSPATSGSGSDADEEASSYIFAAHLDALYNLRPDSANSPYLIGGGGYYHLGTHVYCSASEKQSGCASGSDNPFTTDIASVNAAGFNVGAGIRHKLYVDRHTELFVEARYHYIASGSSPVGQVSMLPVSVGIRW